jgi:hypothetical protein
VILSRRMAQTIGLSETGPLDVQVTLWSVPFKVIGLFDGDSLDQFSDLDGEPMSPVIFPDEVIQRTTEAEMDALESGDEIRSFQGRYTHIPFDSTLIIPFNTLMGMGGSLKSVAVSTDDTKIVSELINHLVDRFGLWLFSGESEGVSIYTASDTLSYSGVPNILIPVLISVCIVLSTMIGSVVERKREIGIYTSVGMAPTHVGVLFIAEAVSYAVLSVVIGYVLAQVFANVFECTRLLSGITVNYSSLAGVGAMGIVMLVVVLSSLYPAYVASTIAIPDVEKAWTLSKPDGNRLTVDLPFLMKPGEVKTAADALHDYVVSHQEISHGAFCVEDIKIDQRIADSALSMAEPDISFTAWLAPFDLGVMQRVCLSFKPAPMQQGYYDIRMTLERQSGEYNTWWRINRRFVNQIRKQLLVWRSMDESRNGIDDRGTAETSADQGGNFA